MQDNGIRHLEISSRHPKLLCVYSTRILGNMSYNRGGDEVFENRNRFINSVRLDWERTLTVPLSHSQKVLIVKRDEDIKVSMDGVISAGGIHFQPSLQPMFGDADSQSGTDAVVTNRRGLFLYMLPADCAVIVMFDPVRSVISMTHVSLLSALNKIVVNTAECMVKSFGSDPSDVEVEFFPSIGACCYDINQSTMWQSLKEKVLKIYGENHPVFNGKTFDLSGFIKNQLINEGRIDPQKIHDSNLCTACTGNGEMFFSNFREKARAGRFVCMAGMQNLI